MMAKLWSSLLWLAKEKTTLFMKLPSKEKVNFAFLVWVFTERKLLRNIFLLTTWLDSKNSNYILVNLSKSLDKNNVWGPSNFVLPYAINHPRCILFKDTYYEINLNINSPADFDLYGWSGHHGPAGNKYFFEQSLLPTMQRNGLC